MPAPVATGSRLRSRLLPLCGLPIVLLGGLLLAGPAQAHHFMELMGLKPTPINGLISGLAHPLLGPDHLLFLLALSLVGLQQRATWMLALLATGLGGSALGLALPHLPGAEAAVAFTLTLVGLVLLDRLPRWVLVPAFGLHGYVLSDAVLGWTAGPTGSYLIGLMLSQMALLLVSLWAMRHTAASLTPTRQRLIAAGLIGCGGAWAWSSLVG
ncbi:HupE/UreJ family protein [Synechococcus sp. CS-1328]|uniref:HupE/UreJ family protein n=1 Tax=Synechococcus sp. CS-1328 TaxID=2847976 RepID=UPI00223C246D|nr:HupE/UreJ family protein [Synechococcus sp. CS-1328]